MGKYAAGELKPPSTGTLNYDNLIQNAALYFFKLMFDHNILLTVISKYLGHFFRK